MNSPIIFLDFDGVICTIRSHFAYSSSLLCRHLDPVGVKMIDRLCENAKAKIVISSTWRKSFDKDAIHTILCNAGMRTVPFHSCWKTPDLKGVCRGEEIAEFLKDNNCENYVILDDDSDMLPNQMNRFVKTDTNDGFLYKHFEEAHKILGVKVK